MPSYRLALPALISAALLGAAACAPVQRYHPAPLEPNVTAARLESRTLLDPGLRQCMARNDAVLAEAGNWPPQNWGLHDLTLAALCLSPELEASRAAVAAAEAARVTAAARPNPELSLTPGVPNPYLLGLSLTVPIETAGKRRLREEQARDLSQAARFALGETAWKIESGVRSALVNYLFAVHQLSQLRSESQLRARQADLTQARLRVGEIARPEWDASRVALANTRVAEERAEGTVTEARAALAAAVGVPVSELERVQVAWTGFEELPGERSLSAQLVQREAVLNRLDVRRALATYAAADAALRQEIARQHPNVNLGPGYQYEEQNSYFTVGFSATLPIFNRNQGPIAEAEARRHQAAAQFLSIQARAIAESQTALARYQSALAQLNEIQTSLLRLQTDRETLQRRAVVAGESDRLQLNLLLIQKSAMAQAALGALGQAQRALGALEDAVQHPLEQGDVPAIGFESTFLNSPSKEAAP